MQRLYNSGPAKGGIIKRIKRADAMTSRIKGPQREDKGKTKDSGCRRPYKLSARRGRKRTRIK